MNKDLAEVLVDEFLKRNLPFIPEKDPLMAVLLATEVVGANSFYQKIPTNKQKIQNEEAVDTLELRRIMVNGRAEGCKYSIGSYLKRIAEESFHDFFYDSNVLCMRITEWPQIVELMKKCKHPYTLLAKHKRYNLEKAKTSSRTTRPISILEKAKTSSITTRPIIIIPGVYDNPYVNAWELMNTRQKVKIQAEPNYYLGMHSPVSKK